MYGKLLCMIVILLTGLLYMFGFIGQESSTDNAKPPERVASNDGDTDRE